MPCRREYVAILVAVLLFVAACGGASSDTALSEPLQIESDASLTDRIELPIDDGMVDLPFTLCEAAARLAAAEAAILERSEDSLAGNDAAVSEWEFRLYGLRYAAQVEIPGEDSVAIHFTTLTLGSLERRTGRTTGLPLSDEHSAAIAELNEVMVRLCPQAWANGIMNRLVNGRNNTQPA